MKRRRFLERSAAVGGLLALAGCTEQTLKEGKSRVKVFENRFRQEEVTLPVQQRSEVVERGVRLAEDAEIASVDDFEAYLDEQGLAVEDVSEEEVAGETVLSLEYVVEEDIEHGRALEVGVVAGAYAVLVDEAFDGEELDAKLLDVEDGAFGEFGEFVVKTDVAEEYNAGEKSAATYGKEALDELEST